MCEARSGPAGSVVRGRPSPEARQPAAATLPPRDPHSPRAPRRCRPWSKEEAAWEEEDGGGQERRQRWAGSFSGRYVRGSLRGGWVAGGNSRHRGTPGPDTQLCAAPGGPGAAEVLAVDGGQGTRRGRAEFGSARVRARAGRREAARWPCSEPRPGEACEGQARVLG